jgi:hypothetical protein
MPDIQDPARRAPLPSLQKAGAELDAPMPVQQRDDPQRVEAMIHVAIFVTAILLQGQMHFVVAAVDHRDSGVCRVVPLFGVQSLFNHFGTLEKIIGAVEGGELAVPQAHMGVIQSVRLGDVVLGVEGVVKGVRNRDGRGLCFLAHKFDVPLILKIRSVRIDRTRKLEWAPVNATAITL